MKIAHFDNRTKILNDVSTTQTHWLDIATRQASQADGHFKVGAVIVRGGRVLASEYNRVRNDPAVIDTGWSIHAEAAALSASARCTVANATLYVARLTPGGRTALARPCPSCAQAAQQAGISRVVFTGDDNLIYRWNLTRAQLLDPSPRRWAPRPRVA